MYPFKDGCVSCATLGWCAFDYPSSLSLSKYIYIYIYIYKYIYIYIYIHIWFETQIGSTNRVKAVSNTWDFTHRVYPVNNQFG